jgi:hypothetical protein
LHWESAISLLLRQIDSLVCSFGVAPFGNE